MPIYAYSCRDCGGTFDIRQEFSDASLTVCDACGGRLRKQFGSIGVTFNGPGFYRTDSRASSSGGTSSSSNKESASKGSSGKESSSTAAATAAPAKSGAAASSSASASS